MVVGGTSYYIESIIYNSLVQRTVNEDEDDDEEPEDEDVVDLSVDAFREHALFRNSNDSPTVDTLDGACRMYDDTLANAVMFARTMPAVRRLPFKRYRNTFVPDVDDDDRERWAFTVDECETAALYAHGVRVLDAVARALCRNGSSVDDVRYEVLAVDVATGHHERYAYADIRSRLDALTSKADGDVEMAAAVQRALCRAHAELEKRTQRLALALLVHDEQTTVDLLSPSVLKAHAAYFDPVAASGLHPHNTRKVFRYVLDE